ncbi:RNA polymerase sigma factor [Roseateles sp. BYS87W]|uniref:RNA polymerase sigma factor n=1 Tax=Pelomonas baiyunensis TaxID=3299026 RepID=A0ABW7H375_9BURK
MNSMHDTPSFGASLSALVPRLRRFGRLLTGHAQDADDLVQLALARAWQHQARWEPGTRLDSWIFRIMQNAWIDEVRARQRQAQVLVADTDEALAATAGAPSPVDAIAVRQAVAQLSEDHRAAVALVLVEGLSYKEAAEALGVPMGTLTSRLARAREQLQALLAPEEKQPCAT